MVFDPKLWGRRFETGPSWGIWIRQNFSDLFCGGVFVFNSLWSAWKAERIANWYRKHLNLGDDKTFVNFIYRLVLESSWLVTWIYSWFESFRGHQNSMPPYLRTLGSLCLISWFFPVQSDAISQLRNILLLDTIWKFNRNWGYKSIHAFSRFFLHFVNQVTIDVHRRAWHSMSQNLWCHDHGHAVVENQVRRGVPQVMKASFWYPCRLQHQVKNLVKIPRIQGSDNSTWEDQIILVKSDSATDMSGNTNLGCALIQPGSRARRFDLDLEQWSHPRFPTRLIGG